MLTCNTTPTCRPIDPAVDLLELGQTPLCDVPGCRAIATHVVSGLDDAGHWRCAWACPECAEAFCKRNGIERP